MLTLSVTVTKENGAAKEAPKKIGEILAERAEIIRKERILKVEELFQFVRNQYLKNPDLMYFQVRIAEISEKLYPAQGCSFFDRKGHKFNVPYSADGDNLFVDFEGDDYDTFVSSLSDEGLAVAVATEEKVLHGDNTKCVYLCIYPENVSIEDYYLKRAFSNKELRQLSAEEFYDLVSEDTKFEK